jgi:DNA-binding NtrC family response regulator
MNPPRILIVDDESSVLLTLAANLELEGLDVATADDGRVALSMIEEQKFDVILSDIRMPGMNGIELFREIRKVRPNVPVILMTAYAMESLINEALKAGAFTVLSKSFEIAQVLPVILNAARAPMALVVDGVSEDAKATADALQAMGVRTRAVFDPQSALRTVAQEAVDVCVIELTTASKDSPTLISRLRSLDPSLSFIVLAGHDLPESIRKSASAEAAVWLRKPPIPEILVESIATARGRLAARR